MPGTRQTPLAVSIHAPTWGATKGLENIIAYAEFQSTHPHGVRQEYEKLIAQEQAFQSTHPHGVRLLNG